MARATTTAVPVETTAQTILLVDDDDSVRRVVRRLLDREGYRVLEATDGMEALAASRLFPGPIHLLLTDVVLPGMSGGQLARHLAEERPGVRVLCMSGRPRDAMVRHGVVAAGIELLEKPFDPVLLPPLVRRLLAPTE